MTLQVEPSSFTRGAAPASAATPAPTHELAAVFEAQRAAQRRDGAPSYEERIDSLERLERDIVRHREDIAKAVSADFGNRSRHESLVAEVFVSLSELRHVKKHLRSWMAPEPRPVSYVFFPGRNEVRYQPLGLVGIISPWNYPLQLALAPLIGALAAGNRVMIKPSEYVPRTSDLLRTMLAGAFTNEQVAVVGGGPEVGEAFSRLPFDHLVYTGSTQVGRLVMRAASENLTPLTLELGGKSPALVLDDAPLDRAAERIMTGKLYNAGQTCVAPDYVLVPDGKATAFVEAARRAVAKLYPTLVANPDYTSLINDRHADRVRGYVEDARRRGAAIIEVNPAGEAFDRASRKLPPTLLQGVRDDMAVMQEEIFGPLLPVVSYRRLEDAIDYVNDRPRPLALYCFSDDRAAVRRVLDNTTSGGATINETMLHVAQADLPFGGVGPSGMGHYHGRDGFLTFSKSKGVFYQGPVDTGALLRAPYGMVIERLLGFLIGR
ncbi:MAG: coniferyl aldehyde dehydrogenase [Polyangiaceae bacterium]|nr:coniferyl aldehyde dehydrogenase [Polyangiaceae bacterium]